MNNSIKFELYFILDNSIKDIKVIKNILEDLDF